MVILKLVKAISVSVVLLAAVTVATVGYFMVFGTDAVRQRADILKQQSAIEAFRAALDLLPKSKAQVSPLVEQAHKLALRINPPKPPERKKPVTDRKVTFKEPEKEIIRPKTVVNTRFNLLATCKVEDYPEKSLALIDLSAEGHKWVREGDSIEHLMVHRIYDGDVVLYQRNKEHSILNVPERKTSSLLKAPPVNVLKNIESEAKSNTVKKALPKVASSSQEPRTTARKETRKLPKKPSKEQLEAMHKESVSELENMIKKLKSAPDSKEKAASIAMYTGFLELMKKDKAAIEDTIPNKADKKSDETKK